VTLQVDWRQALAFRMGKHVLDPVGTLPVDDVVRRLCGVQSQVASSADLAVRVRRRTSRPREVGRALAAGRLVKTWAMRGALHVLPPDQAGSFLSLIASGRSWERPSWVRAYGATPDVMEALRDAAREALDGRALTREELIAEVTTRPDLGHVGEALRSGWGTLLKPLAWQGDLCYGPSDGQRVTFMRPEQTSSLWAGVPGPEEAAPLAVAAYVGAYGPTTPKQFGAWLAGGWFGTRQLHRWFAEVGDRLVEVDVEGERAFVLAEDLDTLASARPSKAVRLLPGFDQWVLGPGTADGHVTPTARRAAVSKQAGWIAPVVIVGGVVAGTWEQDRDVLRVAWFAESGHPPRKALDEEVGRLSTIVGRELRTAIEISPL
jgi:hypothetical protein